MEENAGELNNLETAWSLIRQVRDHDWRRQSRGCWVYPGGELEVTRGGGWHAHGPMEREAGRLLDCLLPLVVDDRPWVIGQLGQSLDGRIATHTGASYYISGLEARVHLHRLRALADAVLIGAGTAATDRPQLTVRHAPGNSPARVVLDPRGRVPHEGPLFETAPAGSATPPTLLLVGRGVSPAGALPAHVQTLPLDTDDDTGRIRPQQVVSRLAEAGYRRVLVEGGGVTVSRFLEAGLLDRLHLLVAPMVIGSGRPGLSLPPIDTLDQALRPRVRRFTCGEDTLFDVDLRA
ncbi:MULTISPECIES: RibD family protein [unclassified Ectothiorhodospira]|uniref:RibD family protein n=1 Tax=unclassified Ectothiorhodospira TaxID=2684909 RepID=UPI001EE911FE|nr:MULTISPECIES: RibD family protein [unclassified Ectothiorhodospira]MCG5514788.1 RibD family protein [Ectothiorhodospira sp. 9100]MCG5518956.1 RibD family protein [Ectothiorhodospira sp. 9905]